MQKTEAVVGGAVRREKLYEVEKLWAAAFEPKRKVQERKIEGMRTTVLANSSTLLTTPPPLREKTTILPIVALSTTRRCTSRENLLKKTITTTKTMDSGKRKTNKLMSSDILLDSNVL